MIKKDFSTYIIVALALLGSGILLFATGKWGIGLSSDSAIYIDAAQNLLQGKGLIAQFRGHSRPIPLTHYPPLFSILIALVGTIGIAPLEGVRLLHALFLGANIFLVAIMVKSCTRDNPWLPIIAALLMLSSVDMLLVHSMAWSEASFIFLGFLGLFQLAIFVEQAKIQSLIISAIAIALCFVDRYIGITFVATGIIGILFFSKKPNLKRLADTGIFAAISGLPMLLWLIRNSLVANNITNRKLVFHAMNATHTYHLIETTSQWLLLDIFPNTIKISLLLTTIISFFAIIWTLHKKKQFDITSTNQYASKLPQLLGIFILFYVSLLIITILFFDSLTPFNTRILSPIYISMLILVLYLTYVVIYYTGKKHSLQFTLGILYCVLVLGYFYRGYNWVITSREQGQGFEGKAWQESKIIKHIKALPAGISIFTNEVDGIFILANKRSSTIPKPIHPLSREINSNYSSEIANMKRELENNNGVLIYLEAFKDRWYFPQEEDLKKQLPLQLVAKEFDGSIYKLQQATP